MTETKRWWQWPTQEDASEPAALDARYKKRLRRSMQRRVFSVRRRIDGRWEIWLECGHIIDLEPTQQPPSVKSPFFVKRYACSKCIANFS